MPGAARILDQMQQSGIVGSGGFKREILMRQLPADNPESTRAMKTTGLVLQEARLARRLDVEEVAKITKIRRSLSAGWKLMIIAASRMPRLPKVLSEITDSFWD
jgi:hypothetical protein